MMTTAASLRKMCQPKFKVADGKLSIALLHFVNLNFLCITDIVNAIANGEFAEVKELKVTNSIFTILFEISILLV